MGPREHLKILQESGLLLTPDSSLGYSSLLNACWSLRHLLLLINMQETLAGKPSEMPKMPFTLAPLSIKGYDNNWDLYKSRHTACIVNEAYLALITSVRDAIVWYRSGIAGQFAHHGADGDISLPVAKKCWVQEKEEDEWMPKTLDLKEPVSNRWIHAEVVLKSHVFQNAWLQTMTSHTAMILFVHDTLSDDLKMFMGYTVPSSSEGGIAQADIHNTEAGQETEYVEDKTAECDLKKGTASPINIRLSTAYGRGSHKSSNISYIESNIQEIIDIFSQLRQSQHHVIRVARLESVHSQEFAISRIDGIRGAKRSAILRPNPNTLDARFWRNLSNERADELYDRLHANVQPLLVNELAPQQFVFCINFILFLRQHTLGSKTTAPVFQGLGGPPGTGKTATVAQAVMLAKNREALLQILSALSLALPDRYLPENLMRDVDAILSLRIRLVAPTNDAVDEMTELLANMIAKCQSNDGSATTIRAVRVNDFERALLKPSVLKLHIRVECARRQVSTLGEEVAKMKAKLEALRVARERTRERSDDNTVTATNHPELYGTSAELRAHSQKQALLKALGTFVDTPGPYTVHGESGQCSGLNKGHVRFVDRAMADVLNDPNVIACFTAGFVNPYHPDVMESCADAIVVLDEATQCSHSHLFALLGLVSGLVLCGDEHQLGAVVKCAPEASYDARHSLLKDVSERMTWLTQCFRLPPMMVRFLSSHVYKETGLYHPTGQNIIRASKLHAWELFRPVLILDVGGTAHTPTGSTSKVNEDELMVVSTYLGMLTRAARKAGVSGLRVSAVSPYTDQAERLKLIMDSLSGEPVFDGSTAGTIESIQGATRDICICSATIAGDALGNVLPTSFFTSERLVVALSRAKVQLVFIGNIAHLQKSLRKAPNDLMESFLGTFKRIKVPAEEQEALKVLHKAATEPGSYLSELQNIAGCDAPVQVVSKWENKGEAKDAAGAEEAIHRAMTKLRV